MRRLISTSMCDDHRFIFEFDKAYTDQLIIRLESSPEHQLEIDLAPPEKGGVYVLVVGRARAVLGEDAWDQTGHYVAALRIIQQNDN